MKAIVLSLVALLIIAGTWGCQIWIRPPHGAVIIAPGHPHDDGSYDEGSYDEDSSDDHRTFKKR